MNSNNTIVSALRFYRSTNERPSLGEMLLLTGISGVFETLPILASLPLLRSLFLGKNEIKILVLEFSLSAYVLILLGLLLVRFILGYYSQYLNGKFRTKLIANFRKSSTVNKQDQFKFGKKTQGLNFLFVGWSQFVPGILYFIGGVILLPHVGLITLSILTLWIIPLRKLKSLQDNSHRTAVKYHEILDNSQEITIDDWMMVKTKSIQMDSLNKNVRELIILITLLSSLAIGQYLEQINGDAGLIAVIMLLRGLQQSYTAYIMSQQLSGLKQFFNE